jgi:chorismate mutase
VRHSAALLVGALLSTSIAVAPAAAADEQSPLYDLVDAAAQRLQTADPVAAFKWVEGGSIEDPARVKQVLDGVSADATSHGIDPQVVRRAFTDQIHATEGIEYARFGQWKLDPGAAPTTAPDLSTSRATIDGFNRTMVDGFAERSDSLRSPVCGRDLADAERAVVADRRLDPLYEQALAFATHSYCD